jgi:hypothetical protein
MLTEEVRDEKFTSQILGTISSADPGFDNNRVESD